MLLLHFWQRSTSSLKHTHGARQTPDYFTDARDAIKKLEHALDSLSITSEYLPRQQKSYILWLKICFLVNATFLWQQFTRFNVPGGIDEIYYKRRYTENKNQHHLQQTTSSK